MAKPWYFQMMGAEIGPLTSAELMDRVKLGQLQPDTLVRSGKDGKWVPADRWKGLLNPKETKPEAGAATSHQDDSSDDEDESQTSSRSAGNTPVDDPDDPQYHLKGEAAAAGGAVPFSRSDEYDFFQFVGFRLAISPPLYETVVAYSHQHQLTLTQITRRAIAQFIGKPELGDDKPPAAPPPSGDEPEPDAVS